MLKDTGSENLSAEKKYPKLQKMDSFAEFMDYEMNILDNETNTLVQDSIKIG